MKNIRALSLVILFISFGCSPQSQLDVSEPSSITPQITISPNPKDPEKEEIRTSEADSLVDVTDTGKIPTPTPSMIFSHPIAGIEAIKPHDIEIIANAGMSWTRKNALQWQLVEPNKGERRWVEVQALDSELINASELGLETILIVRGTPVWAQKVPGMSCGPVNEENLITFGDFLYDAVIRYSQPPFNIKYWELGNEPDVNVIGSNPNEVYGCWGDSLDAYFGGGYYADMLKVVYPRIKAADPKSQILIGGLLLDCDPISPPEIPPESGQYKDCTPAKFLEGILRNGGGQFFDGIAFHAYDYYFNNEGQFGNINWHSSWDSTGPVLKAKSRYLGEILEKFGYPEKFLMNTEGALLCGRDGSEPDCKTEIFNKTKASYIVKSYTIARAMDIRANIWFYIHGWRGSGLLDSEGNPLAAYDALVFNTSILKSVISVTEVQDFSGMRGYSFNTQELVIWVLWSRDDDLHTIHLEEQPIRIYDMMGVNISPTREISIGYSPIYLVWEAN